MFKRLKLKRTKGNILATTIIVGSLAGAVSLSMYAITTSDVKISAQQEDSLLAYQAASAGVDLGLMYYKFNHNVQLSDTCENTNDPACADPTSANGLPIRFYIDRLGCADTGDPTDSRDLSQNHLQCSGIKVNGTNQYEKLTSTNQNPPSNERVVDLKIWYKDNKIGDPSKFNDLNNSNPTIDQDNSYQIDGLEKVNSFQLYLRPKEWAKERDAFNTSTNSNFNGKWPENYFDKDAPYKDWFQTSLCNDNISNTNPNELTLPNTDWCAYYVMYVPALGVDLTGLVGGNPIKGLREPFFPTNANGVTVTLQNTSLKTWVNSVRIRPINMDMQFAIDNVANRQCINSSDPANDPNCHLNIDTGITHIEVTGYYGGAKRTLDTQIDRKTNAFLGIFDRALYVGEGDLAP